MFSRLERVIDDAVARGRIVGVVYLVARDGEIGFAPSDCVLLGEDDRRLV